MPQEDTAQMHNRKGALPAQLKRQTCTSTHRQCNSPRKLHSLQPAVLVLLCRTLQVRTSVTDCTRVKQNKACMQAASMCRTAGLWQGWTALMHNNVQCCSNAQTAEQHRRRLTRGPSSTSLRGPTHRQLSHSGSNIIAYGRLCPVILHDKGAQSAQVHDKQNCTEDDVHDDGALTWLQGSIKAAPVTGALRVVPITVAAIHLNAATAARLQ